MPTGTDREYRTPLQRGIASAEEQISSLDEKMAMPENYSDPEKFGELARQKEQLEEELALLYEQWEQLSENVE